jgi:glucokinase
MSIRFGMDFGGTNLKAGVFDASGISLSFLEQPLPEAASGSELLNTLIDIARDVSRGHPVVAGGLAVKGLVDSERGMVEEDVGAGAQLAGVDLREVFSRALGIPWVVENDARSYAWGEWMFGAGRGARTLVCMTLGTGVGCSVVAGGSPYRGGSTVGGLLGGHVSIDRHGPVCPCGNRGCLELYCSATALHRVVAERHTGLDASSADLLAGFFAAIRRGEPGYLQTFREFVENLSVGVVNAIHAYGPDVVVIGGGVMKSADVILPALTERVAAMAWTVPRGSVRIRAAQLDNRAAALGVAFFPSSQSDMHGSRSQD